MALAPLDLDLIQFRLVRTLDGVDLSLRTAAQHDIGSASRHVGGNGDRARPARLGHDVRLALMLFRVQHLVRDLGADQ